MQLPPDRQQPNNDYYFNGYPVIPIFQGLGNKGAC